MRDGLLISLIGCSSCFALLLLILGIYGTALYNRFTPVYEEVDCGDAETALNGISISGLKLQVGLLLTITCTNPNPYDIQITEPKQGKIYYATSLDELGVVKLKTGQINSGSSQIQLDGTLSLSGFAALSLISRITSGAVHIVADIMFEGLIEENMVVTTLEIKPSYDQKCGLSLDVSSGQIGEMVCADKFDDLVISDIGISLKPGVSALGVDQEVIDDGTRTKNNVLGTIIVASFTMVGLLICCQITLCAIRCRKVTQPRAPQVMQASIVGMPVTSEAK